MALVVNGTTLESLPVNSINIENVIANGKLVFHPDSIKIYYEYFYTGYKELSIKGSHPFPFGYHYRLRYYNAVNGNTILNQEADVKTLNSTPEHAVSTNQWFLNPGVYVEIKPFADASQTVYTDNVFTFTKIGINAEKTTVYRDFNV